MQYMDRHYLQVGTNNDSGLISQGVIFSILSALGGAFTVTITVTVTVVATVLIGCTKTESKDVAIKAQEARATNATKDNLANVHHIAQTPAQFFVPLGSTKQDSITQLVIPETIYAITMFCADDFATLPTWSMVFGTPNPIHLPKNNLSADNINTDTDTINFDSAFMTFDAQDKLQRSVLTLTTPTEHDQEQVFNKLKTHFDAVYKSPTLLPFYSVNMPTNEVIKGFYEPYYLGHVYDGMTTYQIADGFLLLYKRTKGEVEMPKSMQVSFNGIFAEYRNLGQAQPVWVQGTPKQREVIINHYSAKFAARYDTHCVSGG